jgi:hypothetical protein
MRIGDFASPIGKGLVAAAVGTVAITASQMLAQKVLDQQPSTAPADAAEKVMGVEPKGGQEKERLVNVMHFAYGTAWGVPRALMGLLGMGAPAATAAHLVANRGPSRPNSVAPRAGASAFRPRRLRGIQSPHSRCRWGAARRSATWR